MRQHRLPGIVCASVLLGCCTLHAERYPLGVVIAPELNALPSVERQQFHYQWARRAGANAIEHENLPLAGGFSGWPNIETAQGVFDWTAFDQAVADADAADLDVYLEIVTWRNPPQWLFDAHPDAYMMTPLGGSNTLTAVIRDPVRDDSTLASPAHPAMVQGAADFAAAVAARYAAHPRVKGYIIAEEFGLPAVFPAANYYGIDFAPAMRDAFHAYLAQKYGTVGAMNTAWGHPGRYAAFTEVLWQMGWAHDPTNYRGEWFNYYLCLQEVFAEFFNETARAIRAADPDAIIMTSDYLTTNNRVGHGAWMPLFNEVDAVAYKSFWRDQRQLADYCTGLSDGKAVWCSNFSEAATTSGPPEDKRVLSPQYVRRQFWAAFARGLQGAFLWIWTPDQPEKMSLLELQADGTLAEIPAVEAMGRIADFLDVWWPALEGFSPEPAGILVHDPNTALIGSFWDFADPNPTWAHWDTQIPAAQAYDTLLIYLTESNRRFTMSWDDVLAQRLSPAGHQVLCLTGNHNMTPGVVQTVRDWILAGRPAILDDRTGMFDELGNTVNALADLFSLPNVLVLQGINWYSNPVETARIGPFLDQHAPLPYELTQPAVDPDDLLTVERMQAPNGDELAVVVRRGTSGATADRLDFTLRWRRGHGSFTVIDPFARGPAAHVTAPWGHQDESAVVLEGYQDVLLILAEASEAPGPWDFGNTVFEERFTANAFDESGSAVSPPSSLGSLAFFENEALRIQTATGTESAYRSFLTGVSGSAYVVEFDVTVNGPTGDGFQLLQTIDTAGAWQVGVILMATSDVQSQTWDFVVMHAGGTVSAGLSIPWGETRPIRLHYRGDGSDEADLYVDDLLVGTYLEMTPGAAVDFIQWGDPTQGGVYGDVTLDNIRVVLVEPGPAPAPLITAFRPVIGSTFELQWSGTTGNIGVLRSGALGDEPFQPVNAQIQGRTAVVTNAPEDVRAFYRLEATD